MHSEKEQLATNIRAYLESLIHESFTVGSDVLFRNGVIDRETRIGLSGLIGDVLDQFGQQVDELAGGVEFSMADLKELDLEAPESTEDGVENVEDNEEKGLGVDLGFAPTSFEELDAAREEAKKDHALGQVFSDFMALVGNVLSLPGVSKGKELKRLAAELSDRIPGEDEEEDEEEKSVYIPGGTMSLTISSTANGSTYFDDSGNPWIVTTDNTHYDPEVATTWTGSVSIKAAPTKTEGGVKYVASDYACVGDPQKPSTWKVRLAEGKSGNITVKQLGRAAASMSEGGFRGNQTDPGEVGCSDSAIKKRIRSEYRKLGVEDDKIPDSVKEQDDEIKAKAESEGSVFLVWKDEDTGEYRWLGVYSNKFRDNDNPAEILAEESHLRFIERVEKGLRDYPDLYVWHIPAPIGKADLLAFDNSGFSIASGTLDEEFAVALLSTQEDLAMSHGMPSSSIRRNEKDATIIEDYDSVEVSVLPRSAAANKMTDFVVIKEEDAMAIIPDKKRQQVAALLGEELTQTLESRLSEKSEKAIAEGIEYKEEAQQTEETTEETEVTEEVAAEVTEEGADVAEAEVNSEADAAPAEEDEGPVEAKSETAIRTEVAETLATVVAAFNDQNEKMIQLIDTLGERLKSLESTVGEMNKTDEERLAKMASETPEASLQAMLAGMLAGGQAGSVVGNPATRLHGNSGLAKEGPEETDFDEKKAQGEYAGLFFEQWR